MPRTLQHTVYKFNELSIDAKERARCWYRQIEYENADLLDDNLDDFLTVAEILGIEFDTRAIPLFGGGTRSKPAIYFSGFSSQGDGACFEGRYAYRKQSLAAIKAYAPEDTVLHTIARDLAAAQRPFLYRLTARIQHRGRYYHEHCTDIRVERIDGLDIPPDPADAIKDTLKSFMRWIYRQLEADMDYRLQNQSVDENINANQYEFSEFGCRTFSI